MNPVKYLLLKSRLSFRERVVLRGLSIVIHILHIFITIYKNRYPDLQDSIFYQILNFSNIEVFQKNNETPFIVSIFEIFCVFLNGLEFVTKKKKKFPF